MYRRFSLVRRNYFQNLLPQVSSYGLTPKYYFPQYCLSCLMHCMHCRFSEEKLKQKFTTIDNCNKWQVICTKYEQLYIMVYQLVSASHNKKSFFTFWNEMKCYFFVLMSIEKNLVKTAVGIVFPWNNNWKDLSSFHICSVYVS